MAKNVTMQLPLESDLAHMHPLVSWRSVIAGLLVAFLTLSTLTALGMAFGGIGLSDGTTAQSAGVFTGVWFLISSIIALFAGSYFAARISKFHTNRIGSAQGLVIASLFFAFFLYQSALAIGWVGSTTTSAVSGAASAVSSGVGAMAGSERVQMVIEDALGGLNLRSSPETVATGLASRLIQGNVEGARNYLALQAGITPTEAQARIATLRQGFDQAVIQAREGTARALQATGWSLFAMLILGSAAAIGGGALGSLANFKRPLTREQAESIVDYAPAHV